MASEKDPPKSVSGEVNPHSNAGKTIKKKPAVDRLSSVEEATGSNSSSRNSQTSGPSGSGRHA